MEEKIKVSVVMPVYNAEQYLDDSLGTVVQQTLKEIEIICVDDGSTDRSVQIIQEYMERDGRISLLRQKNQYAGVARNAGLAVSKGEYIVFWDADDRFDLEALEKLYRKAKEDDADISVCDARKWDSTKDAYVLPFNYLRKEFMPDYTPFSVEDMPGYIFNFNTNNPWNKMFRRSFVVEQGLYFENRKRANDVFFVMQAMYLAKRITAVDERLIDYRYNTGASLSQTQTEQLFCIYDAYVSIHDALQKRGAFENREVARSFHNKALNLLVLNLDLQTSGQAAQELFDMLRETGFERLGVVDREEGYYYSANVYECFRAICTGSLVDFLLVIKRQKEENLEGHRQRLCKVRRKNRSLEEKVAKLKVKQQELKDIKSQFWFRVIRKLRLIKV